MPEKTNKAGLNGSKIAVLLILGFVNAPSLQQLVIKKCNNVLFPICQICIL